MIRLSLSSSALSLSSSALSLSSSGLTRGSMDFLDAPIKSEHDKKITFLLSSSARHKQSSSGSTRGSMDSPVKPGNDKETK